MCVTRPLTGEPLPLDLLNTLWMTSDGPRDALAAAAGVEAWLAERGLSSTARPAALAPALREAREAIREALLSPGRPAAFDALNAVLARGHIRERLGPDGPEDVLEVQDERWRIPWLAAHELMALLRTRPERVRRCEGEGCVLWFLDGTRSATRRWCSMRGCGNRAKARRHRGRQHGGAPAGRR
jgi:predicted RNA-binding Zn ribbon-like protein